MPQITEETKEHYIGLIRQMRAVKPNASYTQIAEALRSQGIVIDRKYVAELSSIARERAIKDAKFETKLAMITPILERVDVIRGVLFNFMNDKDVPKKLRIMAAEKLMKADHFAQETIYNSGILIKNLGEFGDGETAERVDEEFYQNATKAMENFGIVTGKERQEMDALLLVTGNRKIIKVEIEDKDDGKKTSKKKPAKKASRTKEEKPAEKKRKRGTITLGSRAKQRGQKVAG